MEIKLLAFGQAVEITGKTEWKISEIRDTHELQQKLSELYPNLSTIKYALALNKKIVHENAPLAHGDVVAILPPFSGG